MLFTSGKHTGCKQTQRQTKHIYCCVTPAESLQDQDNSSLHQCIYITPITAMQWGVGNVYLLVLSKAKR